MDPIRMMEKAQNRELLWDTAIGLSVLVSLAATIYSLLHGIPDAFPFLYFLPIILFIYVHPERGVIFSILLSGTFIFLVYYFGFSDPLLIAISTAWFVMFITIGVVTSSFAMSLKTEEFKYHKIFENSQAGTFSFDYRTLIIADVNEKWAHMLGYDRKSDLITCDLAALIPDLAEREIFVEKIRSNTRSGEIEVRFQTRDGSTRQFLITSTIVPNHTVVCSAIDVTERRQAEDLIQKARADLELRVRQRTEELTQANELLRAEIEDRKRFEEAIRLANRKLNTLSNITRHDILNQITALGMTLSLAKEHSADPKILDYLNRIDQITQRIQKQIQFTRDYQNIGTLAPQWQRVSDAIRNAMADLPVNDVAIDVGFSDVEIFADLLLEKVFFNLLENALRHGERVTRIRFTTKIEGNSLSIVCEDDGVGIPAHAKEKIFKQQYYRNTGYGLFLITEILGITGITIRETGDPGNGARFEILVPAGSFRFTSKNAAPAAEL